MATLFEALNYELKNRAAVSDLVGSRIYALRREDKGNPQIQIDLPAITHIVVGRQFFPSHNGDSGLRMSRVQMDIHAENFRSEAEEGLRVLQNELLGTRNEKFGDPGAMAGGPTAGDTLAGEEPRQLLIHGIIGEDAETNFEDEAREYRSRFDVRIFHEKES